MTVFTPMQKLASKTLYAMLSQLTEEQKQGAFAALSLLLPLVEEGYAAANATELLTDIYVQSYDIFVAVALTLKIAEDDGLLPKESITFDKNVLKRIGEASNGIDRTEIQLQLMAKPSDQLQ